VLTLSVARTCLFWREGIDGTMKTDLLQETDFHCPLCGEPLPSDAKECTKCDWVSGYQHQVAQRVPRDPQDIAAGLMSLCVPGAGHFFKGYQVIGVLLLVLGVPVVVTFAFAFTMFFGWLLLPCYWIAVAVDAYSRRNLRPIPLPPRSS
jgi:hypothetical protein